MKTILLALAATMVAAPALAQDSAGALADAFIAAIVAEDADAVAALYTPDATSYGPGGDVSIGAAAIAASWAPFFEAYDNFSVSLDKKGELDMGDTHAAWGLWSMTMTPAAGGDPETATGRFSDVSVKTDGGWKYIVDHASPLAAPAAE